MLATAPTNAPPAHPTGPDRFGPLAAIYRTLERLLLGDSLETLRFCEISCPEIPAAPRALLLGEGDGRFLARLLSARPEARATVVEQSAAMIRAAERRLDEADRGRVCFVRQEALGFEYPEDEYDLVVAHCFLDCFETEAADRLLRAATHSLKVGGILWIGDFVEPPVRGLAWLRLRALYTFFRAVTRIPARRVPPIETLCHELPLRMLRRRTFHGGALASLLYCRRPAH